MTKQEMSKLQAAIKKDIECINTDPTHLIKKFSMLSSEDRRDIVAHINLYIKLAKDEEIKKNNVVQFPTRKGAV